MIPKIKFITLHTSSSIIQSNPL